MVTTKELLAGKCTHKEQALADADLPAYLAAVDGWALEGGKLCKQFVFNNYYETLAFVNATAYVAHAEDHHPELVVTYNRCLMRFDTHSVNSGRGGLSDNDFICAAKIDAVYQQSFV